MILIKKMSTTVGMKYIVNPLILWLFTLLPYRRRIKIMSKHACMFLGYQNLAGKIDDDGDLVTDFDIGNMSMYHLRWLNEYCHKEGIEIKEFIKQYSNQ